MPPPAALLEISMKRSICVLLLLISGCGGDQLLGAALGFGIGANTAPGGTGPQGDVGFDGLHCWDLNGNGLFDPDTEDFDGDELATVWDCRGADGTDGVNGADGDDGTPGGERGPAGADGPPGQNGLDGSDGVDGTDGIDGVDGTDGADGLDGETGIDGSDGIDGDGHPHGPPNEHPGQGGGNNRP